MEPVTCYTVSATYFPGNDNTRRSNDTGMAMAADINKMAREQGYCTEREWFESKVSEYDPDGLWGLSIESYEVEGE